MKERRVRYPTYVNSLTPVDDRWWKRTSPAPDESVTGTATVAIKEMMVVESYRAAESPVRCMTRRCWLNAPSPPRR